MKEVSGFLIDLDGVLYVGNRAVEGAREAVEFLRDRGYIFRFVSNTTRRSRKTIAERLSAMGFEIPESSIFTPPLAAVAYIKKSGKNRCYLLTTGDVYHDFEQGCSIDNPYPIDHVIVGDAGDRVTYHNLGSVTLSATLTMTNSTFPVKDHWITFYLFGNSVNSAKTNSAGVATLHNVSLVVYNVGTSNDLGASFDGDAELNPANASNQITISPRIIRVTAVSSTKVYDDSSARAWFPTLLRAP